jgi:acyl-coenzyme A thioesterase PaaI-like protein
MTDEDVVSPTPADLATNLLDRVLPAARGMQIRVIELEPGQAIATAPLVGNTNHLGTMGAPTLLTLAELLGGVVCLPTIDLSTYYPIVKELTVFFRAPATTAVRARTQVSPALLDRAGSEASATGKGEYVVDVELVDASGQVVATTRGCYQLRVHTDATRAASVLSEFGPVTPLP